MIGRALVLAACGVVLTGPAVAEERSATGMHDLMPSPAAVTMGEGGFPLGESLAATLDGPAPGRPEGALERFAARVSARLERPFAIDLVDDASPASLVIRWTEQTRDWPALGDDESYRLEVTPEGVTLDAPGPQGVLRGLATLAQLVAHGAHGWVLRAATVEDAPRFPWRGLMIDVVRHWMPVEVLERNLDAMEAVKLNVLHLHLTDDQGFRVESRTHPLLHERGSGGSYYSQDEVRHLLDYAADRGIRVVPELDVPGHATSWLVAYPELRDPPPEGLELPSGMGMFHNALDPTREETYEFLDALFGEMIRLFPDQYFHVGGDEVTSDSWLSDEGIRAYMDEHGLGTSRELQGRFTRRVLPLVTAHGKTPVGWDELARVELPAETVIQIWLPGVDPGPNRSVMSEGFYLDRGLSAGRHHANEPLDLLPPGARANLLGGEACMWSELVTPETIDSRIWPRAAAIAERLWSPRQVRDVEDMYRRLSLVRADLDRLGLQHDSYHEPSLARLTGGAPSPALATLAEVAEAPGILERIFSYPALGMMFAPSIAGALFEQPEVGTRFEDVLRPESEVGRTFRHEVESFLDAPESSSRRQVVEEQLVRWRDNHREILKLLDQHPELGEIEPVSEGLADLAAAGLMALEVLDGKKTLTAREKRLQTELLDLHDSRPLDPRELELPEDQEMTDALPELIGQLLVERLKSLQPLILSRVRLAVQPGVAQLVRAAHATGTREVGLVENAAWSLYDRRGTILTVLVAVALVALVVRHRRKKRE